MTLQEWIQTILSACSLIGVAFIVYNFFRNPDIKADKSIDLIKSECRLKHERLDEINNDLKNGILLIKENHLKHMEKDIEGIKLTQEKILTILDERNKK